MDAGGATNNYPALGGHSPHPPTLNNQQYQQQQDHNRDDQGDASYGRHDVTSGCMGMTYDYDVSTPSVEICSVEDARSPGELLVLAQAEIQALRNARDHAIAQSRPRSDPTFARILQRLSDLEELCLHLNSTEFRDWASALALRSVPERVHDTAEAWRLNTEANGPLGEKNFGFFNSAAVSDQFIAPDTPLRAVCYIRTRFDGDLVWASGTGGLVENGHTVQTAGHLLYDPERNLYAAEVWVAISYNGLKEWDEKTMESRQGLYAAVNPKYIDEKKGRYDFGVIHLGLDFSRVSPFSWRTPVGNLNGLRVYIPQYPADKPNVRDGSKQMWCSWGPIQGFDGIMLRYYLNTECGASGAPILVEDGDEIVTIGPHCSGHDRMGNFGAANGYNGNDLIAICEAILHAEAEHFAQGH